MSAVPPKQMLEAILKGAIPAKDRQVFEDMWDAIHRYGKLSKKQVAWIERVFYKLPQDKPKTGKAASYKSSDVTTSVKVRNFAQFKNTCPSASKAELERVKKFFEVGGALINVTPPE
jgi:hypothetical protein